MCKIIIVHNKMMLLTTSNLTKTNLFLRINNSPADDGSFNDLQTYTPDNSRKFSYLKMFELCLLGFFMGLLF